jgi:hypothetical protein
MKPIKTFDDWIGGSKTETEKEKAERIRKEREKKLNRIFKEKDEK